MENLARSLHHNPGDIVEGDCGVSWVYLSNGPAPLLYDYDVETGFQVFSPAFPYSWQVDVAAVQTIDTHTWGGGLLSRTLWQGVAVDEVPFADVFTATASGHALTTTGPCWSLGPEDIELITNF